MHKKTEANDIKTDISKLKNDSFIVNKSLEKCYDIQKSSNITSLTVKIKFLQVTLFNLKVVKHKKLV